MKFSPGLQVGYVYRCYDMLDANLLYIGAACDIYNRIGVHLHQGEVGHLFHMVIYETYENVTVARAIEKAAIAAERPLFNRQHNPDYLGLAASQKADLFAWRRDDIEPTDGPPYIYSREELVADGWQTLSEETSQPLPSWQYPAPRPLEAA